MRPAYPAEVALPEIIQRTLDAGTQAMVTAALAWLASAIKAAVTD